ncbi:hypothetical protein Pmani_017672 [Petrolisthes manimaculis]|uniref:Triple functional domain protein n=1 Tax=Petrolisthes manimaculis TaxID=1843537 RepID=A0AAE1U9L1_9EUCA|nr:hypothetical protein Pmani_017672 [Petrolisthes manimaculis]
MGNKVGGQSQSEEEPEVPSARVPPLTVHPGSASGTNRSLSVENGEEGELEMELPPPMKVMEQPMSAAQGPTPPNAGPPIPPLDDILPDAPAREQHSETSERLKEWRVAGDGCSGDEASSPGPNILNPQASALLASQLSDEAELGGASALPQALTSQDTSPDGSVGEGESTLEQRELRKRHFVISELVETERHYVRDLQDVVEGYIAEMRDPESEMPMPDDLKDGKDKMIFGNLEAIYEWHRDFFMKNIERCLDHPEEIGPAFQRSEKRLQIYVKYCQNKPTSEFIVSEHSAFFEELRQKLGHKLQLPDLLIKPVQRLMKYQLLLRDIHKHTERAGLTREAESVKRALNIMIVIPKAANDMMNVGRLQNFDGSIMAQGKLLLYGPLLCCDGPSAQSFRGKELMLFLFEQSIIFSESGRKKNQFSNPVYAYKSYLQVNKMVLEEKVDDGDPLKFMLLSTDPRKPNYSMICQGSSEDDRNTWVSQIRYLLQTQKDFLKAIQSPIAYQKEKTKNVCGSASVSLRKTLSQPPVHHRPPASKTKANTIDIPSSRSVSNNTYSSSGSVSNPTSPPSAPPTPSTHSTLPTQPFGAKKDGMEATPSSPPKSKRNFFDGFRSTLRPRGKGDGSTTEASEAPSPRGEDVAYPRRWSESGGSPTKAGESLDVVLPTGTLVKVLADFTAVKEDEISVSRGESIQVLSSNALRRYLVHRAASSSCPAAEGWVPANVLLPAANPETYTPHIINSANSYSPTSSPSNTLESQGKKPTWMKFRKPSFSRREQQLKREDTLPELPLAPRSPPRSHLPPRQMTVSLINPYRPENDTQGSDTDYQVPETVPGVTCVPPSPDFPIRIVTPLHNITVFPGEPVEMVCVIAGAGLWLESTTVNWVGPHGPLTDPRFEMEQLRDGTLRLHVGSCRVTDAGEYTCRIECSGHTIACSARLNLAHEVVIEEETDNIKSEEKGEDDNEPTSETESEDEDEGEDSGAGAGFLLNKGPQGKIKWHSGFQKKYSVMDDMGKGRFSMVKRCCRTHDGKEVAAKFIRRGRQDQNQTEGEYIMLRSLRHPALVRSIALYTATPKFDVLVMELVMGLPLLDWVFTREETTESECSRYLVQVIAALQYLHTSCVAYLDLKPENLLVDILRVSSKENSQDIDTDCHQSMIRLIDFGGARVLMADTSSNIQDPNNLRVPPENLPPILGSPEFLAPEILAKEQVGAYADHWSLGVLLYVLVSGRSPFLGTSPESTRRNILSCDVRYPVEHFATVTQEACDLIQDLLTRQPEERLSWEEVLAHPWFNMTECESVLPIQSLADFCFRRTKIATSVQELSLS